jgi:hypothetical protein
MPDIEHKLIYPKIIEKLGWLADYEADLIHWNQMELCRLQHSTEIITIQLASRHYLIVMLLH